MIRSEKTHLGIYAASFGFFVMAIVGLGAGFVSGAIERTDLTAVDAAQLIGIYVFGQFAVVHTIFNCLLLHRMWSVIQDGQTTLTARRAIGFLFIPLFNFYWIFRAWASYPAEFNRYVERYDLPVVPLAGGRFVAYPILLLAAAVVYVPLPVVPFAFLTVARRACGAVDALKAAKRERREEMLAEIRMPKIIR